MPALSGCNIGVSSVFVGFKQDASGVHDFDGIRGGVWASSQIQGKFRALVPLRHRNLCAYVDIIKSRHERMLVVSECYTRNLMDFDITTSLRGGDLGGVPHLVSDVCHGLQYLNDSGFTSGCLSPETIVYDGAADVFKISDFGTLHVTGYGSIAPVKFSNVKYLAPELLALGPDPPSRALHDALEPQADIWSLGIILCDIMQVFILSEISVKYWTRMVLDALVNPSSNSMLGFLGSRAGGNGKLQDPHVLALDGIRDDMFMQDIPLDLRGILELCCTPSPHLRVCASEILSRLPDSHAAPVPRKLYDPHLDSFPPVKLRCRTWDAVGGLQSHYDEYLQWPINSRSVDEIYRLWTLAGGDPLAEVRTQGYAREKPAILTVPTIASGEFIQYGSEDEAGEEHVKNRILLDVQPLLKKLEDFPPEMYFPLLMRISDAETVMGRFLEEARSLTLVTREADLKYQLWRQILFHRLLMCYPFTLPQIRTEAACDIPPLYRARVWAALLGVKGDVEDRYESIDKISPCSSDRQIEVDIPRCHQYNPLMASSEAHGKLKRILKAWITDHPQFVYWQGLDSLCAPFVYLNFSNEALAYSCVSAFVEKYVYKFFLKDNTPVIQEYLAAFSHLLAFHEPKLFTHMTGIGFVPELYSIPWFLTMFTHVFPLHKIFHLWDQLLLGDDSFPLFVGLSLLHKLKFQLLDAGFNECILMFSDFPDLDIQECLKEAQKMYEVTPHSATYRAHAGICNGIENHPGNDRREDVPNGSCELDLEIFKAEVSPRITWEEILWLNAQAQNASSGNKIGKPLLVDVRTPDEYGRGTLSHSLNIPFLTAFDADGKLISTFESRALRDSRNGLIVVFDGKCAQAPKFAAELVRLEYPRVCCLHQGVDQLKTSGFITVPTGS